MEDFSNTFNLFGQHETFDSWFMAELFPVKKNGKGKKKQERSKDSKSWRTEKSAKLKKTDMKKTLNETWYGPRQHLKYAIFAAICKIANFSSQGLMQGRGSQL